MNTSTVIRHLKEAVLSRDANQVRDTLITLTEADPRISNVTIGTFSAGRMEHVLYAFGVFPVLGKLQPDSKERMHRMWIAVCAYDVHIHDGLTILDNVACETCQLKELNPTHADNFFVSCFSTKGYEDYERYLQDQ